jgi:predicted glutamine amidotransferase
LRGRAHQIRSGTDSLFFMRGEGRMRTKFAPDRIARMCRVFGCVAAEPVSIRHELLEAENPLIRQSEEHDSGWGMAVYERAEGGEPQLLRFPSAAYADDEFDGAADMRGRIFNAHFRRATMGELCLENTHPFCLGCFTLGHNGTILRYPRLLRPHMRRPEGNTDSEHLFNLLMHDFDDGDPVACIRATMRRVVECSPFSGLNILFADGEKLFAYRLGLFELHWLARPGQLLVASERVTREPGWHSVQQDVLLTLDPNDLEAPHAERLLGDEWLERAQVQRVDLEPHLRGAERGAVAAERARAAAAAG